MVVRFLLVIVIVRCVSYMQRMELMQIGCRGNILTNISTIHFHSFHSVPYFINFQYHCGIFDDTLWYAGGGKKSWRMKTNTWFHPASFPQVWCFLSDCYPIPGKYNNLHLVDDKMRKLRKIWYSWIIFPRIISNRVYVINIKLGLITLDPKINN